MKSNPIIISEQLKDKISLEMVLISEGQFLMGCNKVYEDEQFVHKVNMKSFYMSKYPITQAQYEAVIGENPSYFKGENNPVECVSWNDAQEFCQKLSQQTGKKYKLPSESQWEYACRTKNQNQWCFGDDVNQLGGYAWYIKNSNCQPHPVGLKKPNKWGLYDMHGNVWEWCEDDYLQLQKSKIKVLRGGSFDSSPSCCRSMSRSLVIGHDYINHYFGFRVVCVIDN